jgi:glycosyltransferase involved in cell wall biosynthesis
VVLIASPYIPFPLAHGAAVRIYNLVREAARDFDVVLVAFVEAPHSVPRELLDLCAEVVTVWRPGTHALPDRWRPDTGEEFDTPTFHAALRQTIAKWRPKIVQLEFTQMAVYAADCGSTPTILVEHDITYDLYAQLVARPETNDWETQRQHERWVAFETEAWKSVTRVVTMSDKDRTVVGERAIAVGNGVDLERFYPNVDAPEPRDYTGTDDRLRGIVEAERDRIPEAIYGAALGQLGSAGDRGLQEVRGQRRPLHQGLPAVRPADQPGLHAPQEAVTPQAASDASRRLLFIGSFAHRPNVLALEFFLRDVMPHLRDVTLHVIAGKNHSRFWDLRHPNVEIEGFVSDVRPAYRSAVVVIAPLIASAGTNVKIVEAMAMGKAIVSTEAGIHGLELELGEDVIVENDPKAMAAAITLLLTSSEYRRTLERNARATAERVYGWQAMGKVQKQLYESLL